MKTVKRFIIFLIEASLFNVFVYYGEAVAIWMFNAAKCNTELMILFSQPAECWDFRHASPD